MSCLFNSLQHFLPIGTNETRQAICDYLEQNHQIIDGIETSVILEMDRPNYIAQMRKNSTWGGAIEIQAGCNIWNMTVHVYDIRTQVNNYHLKQAFNNKLTRKERLRHRRLHFEKRDNFIVFNPVSGESNRIIKLNWNGGHYTPRNN